MRKYPMALWGFALWLLMASAVSAQEPEPLPYPAGAVILEVSGDISIGNAKTPDGGWLARFDLEMLDALGDSRFRTTTPWDSARTYSGPAGSVLLDRLGAGGKDIIADALNDYSASIPRSDFMARGAILATRVDGRPMTVRDKGPIFVVYPFDDRPELNRTEFFQRSVWQLSRLHVE